jgi:hypothetical protein
MLSQLDDCLIVDTEKGTHMVEAYVQEVNNREELIQTLKDAMEGHEFKVASIADLTFGKGYALAREKVMNTINAFRDCCDHLIIVGHRKVARAVIDGKALVEPESLDITGKLKNLIMSDCDAIGYVLREDDKLMVSFKADESIEAGSRCEHLRGQCIDFDWSNIYKTESEGK